MDQTIDPPHHCPSPTRDGAGTGPGRPERLRLYEHIITDVPDHLCYLDRDYVYRVVNDAHCRAHGRPREAIEGRSVRDLFGEQVFEQVIRPRLDRCLGGEVVCYEEWFDFPRARRRYLGVVYTPYRDGDAEVAGVVASGRDITELHLARTARQASEELTRAVLQTAVDAIVAVDDMGRIVFANPAATRLTGYSGEELQQRPVVDLIPRAYRKRHLAAFSRHLMGEPSNNPCDACAFTLLRRDGQEVPVEVSLAETRGANGPLFIGVLRDVSERHRAEEKLRQAAKVVDSTTEGVLITDADGNFIAVNRAFTDITGYTQDEVVGRNPRLLRSGRHDDAFYQSLWASVKQTGSWHGEIWNRRKSGELYPELLTINAVKDAGGNIVNYVGVFSDISQMKRSEAELAFLAHHDPLTELPNRLLLDARLEHAIERAQRESLGVAVLFIDLDNFKTVNDSLGHPAGDRLLRAVAARLSGSVRREDTVARLGGDEFVVVLEGLVNTDFASDVAEKLLKSLGRAVELEGQAVYPGASIGISTYPADGSDPIALLKNADAAMYQSKSEGRNTFRFYRAELTRTARERLSLETDLRRAIQRQELALHFQPQVDVASGAVVGVEALARWEHPDLGQVPPARFIPLAEETGLILPLGDWLMFTACEQFQDWLERGLDIDRLALNLSAHQFRHRDLLRQLQGVLDATGLPPGRLALELTESAVMAPAEQAPTTLVALRDLGVTLAIDDFGTGYSSLACLRRFPIHVLKIDQSFMQGVPQDRDAAEIAATIIAMGRSLHLQVVAEGVENREQLAFLQRHGCDAYQGHFHSAAMPAQAFEALIRSGGGANT